MTWIGGETVSGSSTNAVTFNNIPQTFTHLQIRVFGRTSANYESDAYNMQPNTNGTSNCRTHSLNGNGTNAVSEDFGNSTNFYLTGTIPGNTAPANCFGVGITDILDYTSTSKNKTTRTISGFDPNNTNAVRRVNFGSGLWFATPEAITRLNVTANNGNFIAGTRIDLYGITVSSQTGA